MPVVHLTEWQNATPGSVPALAGLQLPDTYDIHLLVRRLRERQILTVRELRSGLEITTGSFVGSLAIGPLTIRIRPKVDARAFGVLIGYALGLPHVELLQAHTARLTTDAFQDVIIASLADEAARLLARGIHRHYLRQELNLGSPRGRIHFGRLAEQGPALTATVTCEVYERDENVLPNRVLLSGLRLASSLALDAAVRRRTLRSAGALGERVRPIALTPATFRALARNNSRLTSAYAPALALTRLLLAGRGISTDEDVESFPLPGFAFDMNRLFQNALGRFIREFAEGFAVREQHSLTDLFAYQPLFNPRARRPPTPRPDYVFIRNGRVIGMADAKYRDLWTKELPPAMLYQLSVYALSQPHCDVATILYTTEDRQATEARISINDPMTGRRCAEVRSRPVSIERLAHLVQARSSARTMRERQEYASYLTVGRTVV